MFKNLLVAISGDAITQSELKKVVKLAKIDGAKISLAFITDPVIPYSSSEVESPLALSPKEYKRVTKAYAEKLFAKAQKLIDASIEVNVFHIYHPNVSDGIIEAAKKSKSDVIIMASHKRTGLRGVFLRSESQEVILHSKIPVLVLG